MRITLRSYSTFSISECLHVLFSRSVAYAILASVAGLLFIHWLSSFTAGKYSFLPMLPIIVWSVRSWGVIPAIAASLTGLMGCWTCIVPPPYSFSVPDPADIVGLVLLACGSVFTIIVLGGATPKPKIAGGSDVEAIKAVRLAMQGLLSEYCETVCICKGGGHDPSCMAHPSSPIILCAERSIRWMYQVEEASEEYPRPTGAWTGTLQS